MSLKQELSIIIPIDLSRRGKDILNRIILIIELAKTTNYNIIFGHNDRNTDLDKEFKNIINKNENVYLSSFKDININLSKLRNEAFKLVSTEYLLLLDIDIYLDTDTINKMLQRVKENKTFDMLPCVYLGEKATKRYISKKSNSNQLLERYFKDINYYEDIMHIAIPSSIILLKSEDYNKLKGFDENFIGHGYEDFDFMIRLSLLYNRIQTNADLLSDKTYKSPMNSIGFRSELGKLTISNIIEKNYMFHLFHKKENQEDYYLKREINKKVFEKKLKEIISGKERTKTLLEAFQDECIKSDNNIKNYEALICETKNTPTGYKLFKRRLNKRIREIVKKFK